MPTSQATLLSRCLSCAGAIVLLSLNPVPAVAAPASAELRRADNLDMRRAGKVSEDERAVLRIEWRAGLSGVDADRQLQEITAKLRHMETGVTTVHQLIRNMPSEKPAPAKAAVGADDAAEAGLDWRLMAANLTALILVIIWWVSRRRNQLAAAALEAKLAARTRVKPAVEARAEPDYRISDVLPANHHTPVAAVASTIAETSTAAAAPDEAAFPTAPAGESADAAAAPTAFLIPAPGSPPEAAGDAPNDTENFAAPAPPLIDFVLEEADPATMVPERPRPAKKPATITPASVSASLNKNVEPTLQLAEIMLSMGLEQGAAQALMEYTEANPRDAIYHMLKLLGIYRRRGLHKEFQETAEKLRKNFNIQAEDWAKSDGSDAPTLEKFSRVSQHVQSIWQDPNECITYLRRLLEDNRDGARAGFPQSVAEEILLLVEILKANSGVTQDAA